MTAVDGKAGSRYPNRIRSIALSLSARYGDFAHYNKKDPYRELIFILCSTMTQEAVYRRVYSVVLRHFPTPESLAKAKRSELMGFLTPGGLARRKASHMQQVARELVRRLGPASMKSLGRMPDQELEAWLTSLPGIGKKVARCVMLYAFDREVFPVDTHCWRVAQRLHWIGTTTTTISDKGADALQEMIPSRLRRSLHVNFVSLGRDTCRANRPDCRACVLHRICPSAVDKPVP